ncbi:MAG: proprotein convertase P-domain-containing protein [Myxococcales bacterium]|nr:proprotein convertase P-domain-containing protein [Myxococcales bacterium]
MLRSVARIALALTFVGCVAPLDPASVPEGLDVPLIDAGSPEEAGVLALVNDPATTFELLDVDVGLDRRAARGLVDGRPFGTIAEVDAVPYVGRVALAQLLAYARDGGFIPAPDGRDAAILAFVNDAATTFEMLDDDVGLDRRAAEGIVASRPFATIAELDAVPWVGATALEKLGEWALAHGYGPSDPAPSDPVCVIVSEYMEGSGNNNKAVELFNCGAAPVDLARVGVCLVANDDTDCSAQSLVGEGALAPGAVWTTCRTQGGTFNDPFEPVRAACDAAIGGAAVFNGDDRLVVFYDADGDGRRGAADPVLDTFGDPAVRPAGTPWAETDLRRCDLTPGAPDPDAKFTRHARTAWDHLGVPPPADCGVEPPLAREGEDCTDHASCEAGLRCYGRPNDGSGDQGKCVDPTAVPGEGASCDRYTPCSDGLICAGWTLWAEGTCNPTWMAGRWSARPETEIPAGGAASASVVAYGLASVPVDIEVQLHLEHPRYGDLRVTLTDPNGDAAVLWDRSPELAAWSRSFVTTGISRDDQVNGRWTVTVEDLATGETGTFVSFDLFIVSRWD